MSEMNRMDAKRAAGCDPPWTCNAILHYAFMERPTRKRDATCARLLATTKKIRRLAQLRKVDWIRPLLRVVFGVCFTQARRDAALKLEPHCWSASACRHALQTIKCGHHTFHAVISRSALAHCLERLIQPLARALERRTMFADQEDAATQIARRVYQACGRRAYFHAWEVVLHLMILPVRFKSLLKDGGKTASLRVGSAAGLRILQRQRHLKSPPSLADISREHQMAVNDAQTCLCLYNKYVRWYHSGITKWYRQPGRAFKAVLRSKRRHRAAS